MRTVNAVPGCPALLGRLGENEVTQVVFDVSDILSEYPEASTLLLNRAPGSGAAYPVACTEKSGNTIIWTVGSEDLAKHGRGQCELVAAQGSAIKKTVIYDTEILPALDAAKNAPEPWNSWQALFAALRDEAVQDAREARARIPLVASLDDTQIAVGTVIEAVGVPKYVDDVSQYSAYGITDTGWYLFVRVTAPNCATVTAETTVTGAAGAIVEVGADHIDLAVRFGVAAESCTVTVNWSESAAVYVFKASDLAVRNLDYRTTFYVYDLAEFVTWQYALTSDATFVADKKYYTLENGVYTLAEVTAGEAVPENTYYNHSKVVIQGMTRNITYRLDEIIDCPQEVVLPEVEDDTHGCWFEFQLRHSGTFSMTLTVPEGVKIATEHTQSETAGFNLIDLHYMKIDNVKMWRFMNTHSSIPTT